MATAPQFCGRGQYLHRLQDHILITRSVTFQKKNHNFHSDNLKKYKQSAPADIHVNSSHRKINSEHS